MIAVNEGSSPTVLLFKTLRGYRGGQVEPVDFLSSRDHGNNLDAALTALGYVRQSDWQQVPDHTTPTATYAYNAYYAKVTPS